MQRADRHDPVFIGGTGRCGTHALAALASRSGRHALVPAELRLHTCESGLPPFAAGTRGRRWLLRRLRAHWWRWHPSWDPANARGVHRLAPRRRYAWVAGRLCLTPPGGDRIAACRRFVDSLLDPLAPAPGAWIEKSPANCAAAQFLHAMYPGMRLIHVLRDGRDVACSLMRVPWAPDSFESALAHWEWSLIDAHNGTMRVPQGQVHRVQLEELFVWDRDATYRRLLAFLGIPDEPPLREFFDTELAADRVHAGRWASDLPRSEHPRAEALYRASLERLAERGVPAPAFPPNPDQATPAVRSREADAPAPSSVDPWAAATA